VTEPVSEESKSDSRALTDGANMVWFYRDSEGCASVTRYGLSDVTHIFNAIEQVFGVGWVDEYNEDLDVYRNPPE
jgi:hypothetical protein